MNRSVQMANKKRNKVVDDEQRILKKKRLTAIPETKVVQQKRHP